MQNELIKSPYLAIVDVRHGGTPEDVANRCEQVDQTWPLVVDGAALLAELNEQIDLANQLKRLRVLLEKQGK